MYHLFPFRCKRNELIALKADLIGISLTMGATPAPFISQLEEALASAAVHGTFVVLTVAVVVNGRFENDRLMGRAGPTRIVLIVLQFILAELQALLHLGYESPFWWMNFIFYLLGFTCFLLKRSKRAMPWHNPLWYGWHEDSHVSLFFADVFVLIAAVWLLSDPSRDKSPNLML
jgi:hypothetical protein